MILNDKQIFIVEDNMKNRVIFQVVLSQYGAQVCFEKSGHEALYRLQTLPHADVIILDLMLPNGQSGYDIFDQIRKLPNYDDVPIVAVSSTDPSEAIQLTRMKGFAGFISKPIDSQQFPRQIAAIIDGEKIWLGR